MRTPERTAYDKAYYKKNRKKHILASQEYYKANREKILAYSRERYLRLKLTKRDEWNAKGRKSYLKNREKSLAWHRNHHKSKRIELLTRLGGCRCKSCGFSDWRALQVDHVNGDGYTERVNGKCLTRKKQLALILNEPERYQVLCANCNFIKRYENQETAKKRIPAINV